MPNLFERTHSLNTPIECFIFDAGIQTFPIRPHWHYFYELIYILEGCAEMHSSDAHGADRCYSLSAGDLIVFHSQSVHSIYTDDPAALRYAVLKFDMGQFAMTSASVPKLRSIFRRAEQCGMDICFTAKAAEKLDCERIFSACIDEAQRQEYGCGMVLQAQIYTLLMNIIRRWVDSGLVISTTEQTGDSGCDIDSVTEYIDTHIDERLRVCDIAAHCGLSYSCFAKKFHEMYSMSCKEYIERMRIFKAEELLLFTGHDLNYISQETGFSDCSHLIKSFRNLRGITPKQFRMVHGR